MSSGHSLLHWFKEKENVFVKTKIKEHAVIVESTCKVSTKLYKALQEGKLSEIDSIIADIDSLEKKADSVQDELAEKEIIRGSTLPVKMQEDLFRMVRRVDETANWVKSASKNINLSVKLGIKIAEEAMENFVTLAEIVYKSSSIIVEIIDLLGIDDRSIIDKRNLIEQLEREADEVHYGVKEIILTLDSTESSSTFYLSHDISKALENSSDACSKAADYIFSIVMAGSVK